MARPVLSPVSAELAERVGAALGQAGRLGVAYSGGVDSSVVLAIAARRLGPDRVWAILGVSPSLAASERQAARRVAEHIGVPLVELATNELDLPAYRANGPDRCLHCKRELFGRIDQEVMARYGLDAIAYGENADDAARLDRPGAAAASEHGVLRPLAEAGLGKAEVRLLAHELGLPNADKPAAPCLASRLPHFAEVTPDKLAQIEAAEAVLHTLGLADVRVRHHGEVARIEVAVEDLPRIVTAPARRTILDGARAAGFRFVCLDLAGIQSGAFTTGLLAGQTGERGGHG